MTQETIGQVKREQAVAFLFFPKKLQLAELPCYDLQRFAAEDEGRTELPGERRRREERLRGNVARSQEIVSATVLLGAVAILFLAGTYIISSIQTFFLKYLQNDFSSYHKLFAQEEVQLYFLDLSMQIAKIVAPIMLVSFVMAIVGNISQVGLLFTLQPLALRIDRLRPDFRRVLPSRRTLFNLGRVTLQVVLVAVAAYIIISQDYLPMLQSADMGLGRAVTFFGWVAFKLLVVTALILAILSVPDYLYQRFEYFENLKITFSEARRERKDEEGDPLVRQRQRDRAYELRRQRKMLQEVPDSDVVIVNPTHFAVALKYEPNISQAPVVVAKGADHVAFLIRRIAQKHDILIEENPALARTLYREVEVGHEIPETLYQVISLVFARIDRFRNIGATA